MLYTKTFLVFLLVSVQILPPMKKMNESACVTPLKCIKSYSFIAPVVLNDYSGTVYSTLLSNLSKGKDLRGDCFFRPGGKGGQISLGGRTDGQGGRGGQIFFVPKSDSFF